MSEMIDCSLRAGPDKIMLPQNEMYSQGLKLFHVITHCFSDEYYKDILKEFIYFQTFFSVYRTHWKIFKKNAGMQILKPIDFIVWTK